MSADSPITVCSLNLRFAPIEPYVSILLLGGKDSTHGTSAPVDLTVRVEVVLTLRLDQLHICVYLVLKVLHLGDFITAFSAKRRLCKLFINGVGKGLLVNCFQAKIFVRIFLRWLLVNIHEALKVVLDLLLVLLG